MITAAIKREYSIIKVFWKGIIGIIFGGPVVIYLIPYLRQLRQGTELNPEIWSVLGLIGVSSYMVFYMTYETMKYERENRLLERVISFWKIRRVIFVKCIVASIMGGSAEIMFIVISSILRYNIGDFSVEIIIMGTLNIILFSWIGIIIMCITDNILGSIIIASIPCLEVTFILTNMIYIFLVFILLESVLGLFLYLILKQKVKAGNIDWLQ